MTNEDQVLQLSVMDLNARQEKGDVALLNHLLPHRALVVGTKPWNRRKIIFVGEARVGKTALCNSMMGKRFVETETTAVLTQLTCDLVIATVASDGRWTEYINHETEYETGAAEDQILSLLDFGGHTVLKIIHHIFLASNVVYMVVFNMEDMLLDDQREKSLSELSFWINSIVAHSSKSSNVTHIFLVGTHKDVVSDMSDLHQISEVIEARFPYTSEWTNIQGNDDLCFFPVNNLIGQNDVAIVELMSAVERVVDHLKEPCSLTWFRTLDALMATKKSFVMFDEASSIAAANGVEESDVPLLLSFLNKMGVVLWLDEEGLRHVVILDIMTFFVEPAALVLCDHVSKPLSSTIQHSSQTQADAWDRMVNVGGVGCDLINSILGHLVEASYIPVVIDLMQKYGLMVLERHANPHEYFVPSLLQLVSKVPYPCEWNCVDSCYFVFCSQQEKMRSCLRPSDLKSECFLPHGLMERLLGQISSEAIQLYRNCAVLRYGCQQFRLVSIPEMNCIRLDVEGQHQLSVYDRVRKQIGKCLEECTGSTQLIAALRVGTASEIEDGFTLLNLEALRNVRMTGCSILVEGIGQLDVQYVSDHYGSWLPNNVAEEEKYKT